MLASILLLATSLLSLTSALPTASADADASPAELVPRACATLGPSIIDILEKGDPDHPHNGQVFNLARGGTPASNNFISVVTFNYIPAGATGCMLRVHYPPFQHPNQIAIGDATQADVWSVAPDPAGVSTWNHPPARDQFVATTIFPEAASTEPFETILMSNTCKPTMSFLFEQSNWQQGGGSVQFYNTLGGKQGLQPLGFSMIFNC
jgi:hypothetical protein